MKNKIQIFFNKLLTRHSEKVALIDSTKLLTYGDLKNKIYSYERFFSHNNIQGERIVVWLERSLLQTEIAISVLYSGNVYIPIEKDTPVNRVEYIIEDSRANYIITEENLFKQLSLDRNIKCIDPYNFSSKNISDAKTDNSVNAKLDKFSDAYIIYTSGTTGHPKGVRISVSNFYNLLKHSKKTFSKISNYKSIMLNSLSFDFSIWEMMLSVTVGGSLYFVDDSTRLDQLLLLKYIKENQINHLSLTPSFAKSLIMTAEMFNIDMDNTITELLLGAEKLSTSLVRKIFDVFGEDLIIYNAYGPTEGTVCAFMHKITSNELKDISSEFTIPIGRPYQKTKYKIVYNSKDKNEGGNLLIAGPNISSRGYLNNDSENERNFFYKWNRRWYDTGDIVKYLPGRKLSYISRSDQQVKVNGYRVELEEVANCLNSFRSIQESFVIQLEHSNEKDLVAFYVQKENQIFGEDELRRYCFKKIAKYMIPKYFINISSLPLTSNGKIDEKYLEELARNSIKQKEISSQVTPNSDVITKKSIIEIFKAILKVEILDLNLSFFENGGRSLDAINLQSQLNIKTQKQIPITMILGSQSLNEIIEFFVSQSSISVEAKSNFREVSPFQSQMWTLHNLDEKSNKYNTYFAFEINEKIDIDKLKRCFINLHNKVDILRSSIVLKNNKIKALISDEENNIKIYEYDEIFKFDDLIKKLRLLSEEIFELQNSPLYEIHLLKTDQHTVVIYFKFHHIIVDQGSIESYFELLTELYNNEEFEIKEQHYYDINWRTDNDTKWTESINNNTNLLQKVHEGRNEIKTENFLLDRKLTKYVQEIANTMKVPSFFILLHSFCLALAELKHMDNYNVGIPMSTRTKETQSIIGPFLNVVPMYFINYSNMKSEEVIKKNFKNYCDSLNHIHIPLIDIVSELDYRPLDENPLFNVLVSTANFNFDNKLKLIEIEQLELPTNSSKFPIASYFDIGDEQIETVMQFESQYFNDIEIEKLKRYFLESINTNYNLLFPKNYSINKQEHNLASTDIVKQVWENVLQKDITENTLGFFEAGGDSILAIQLALELKKLGFDELKPRDVFKYPTVNLMTEYINNSHNNIKSHKKVDYNQTKASEIYELAPIQNGILWECINNKEQNVYHQQYIISLKRSISSSIFKKSVNELLNSFTTLSNRFFFKQDGTPVQSKTSDSENQIIFSNIGLEKTLENDFNDKFNLELGRLIRFYLVQNSDENDYIVISYHHILLDGWSIALVIEKLFYFIDNFEKDKPIIIDNTHPQKEISAIRKVLQLPSDETMDFWKTNLRELNKSTISPNMNHSVASVTVNRVISENIMQMVDNLSTKFDIPKSAVFFSAYLLSLKNLKEDFDFNIGVTTSGRQNLGTDEIDSITCLINTLPLHIHLTDINVDNILVKSADLLNKLHLYGDIPLNTIQNMSSNILGKSVQLFDKLFVYQNYPNNYDEYQKLWISGITSRAGINLNSALIINQTLDNLTEIGYMCNELEKEKYVQLLEDMIASLKKIYYHFNKHIKDTVRSIWIDVLNRVDISDDDNFFKLGGDSISCLRISLRLKKEGYIVNPDVVFNNPTINKLVLFLSENIKNSKVSTVDLIETKTNDKYFGKEIPQSEMQKSIFFECLKQGVSNLYMIQSIYTIKGKFDIQNLVMAAKLMIQKHPIFRTRFKINDNGEAVQELQSTDDIKPDYNVIDLRNIDSKSQFFESILEKDKENKFSFEEKSLIRCTVVRLSNDEFKLIFTYHHILLDGWSAGIAQNEFFDIYDKLNQNIDVQVSEDLSFVKYCMSIGGKYIEK